MLGARAVARLAVGLTPSLAILALQSPAGQWALHKSDLALPPTACLVQVWVKQRLGI